MSRTRTWTLATAVVAILVLVAGWFLLIAPTRANAADIQAQTVDQEAANIQLASKIEQLKVQAQDIPAMEAEIAKFRQLIPAQPALPSYIRSLTDISKAASVTLVSVEPQTPATVTEPEVVTSAPTGPVDSTTGEATTDTSGSAPVAGTTGPSVQYVQAQVTIQGGYFNTEQFLAKLEKLKRAFLVTGFDISADSSPEAASGDVVTNLQVRIFYAPATDSTASGATSSAGSTTATN